MDHPELGTFIWCPIGSCVKGEWSAKAEERGWIRRTEDQEFVCPRHKYLYEFSRTEETGIRITESGDGTVTVTIEDYDFMDDSAGVLEFGLSRERFARLYEIARRHLLRPNLYAGDRPVMCHLCDEKIHPMAFNDHLRTRHQGES